MSFSALNTAAAGLKATQAQIGVVSQNIANVGTTGYVKRTLDTVFTNAGNAGVATGTIARVIDAAALKQLRSETSGAAYTSMIAQVRSQIDTLFGTPGSANALDGLMNTFTQSLQTLSSDPTSTAARSQVVAAASSLASGINGVAEGIQSLRTAMEAQLSTDTSQASTYLASIASLNAKITATPESDGSRADLEDQRDQALTSLSALMDVNAVPQTDGTVTVLTTAGATLVDHAAAASLSFDSRGTLTAGATYDNDPTKRGVGTIVATTPGGATIDLVASGAIRSGSLAAELELRDSVLPQAQRQMDDLAAGLSRALTDAQVTGTAASAGGKSGFDLDLTGLSAGNAITLTLKDSAGATRNLILMPSNTTPPASVPAALTNDPNATIVPITIPNPSSSDPSAVRTAIANALGSSFTVSAVPGGASGAVRILSNGASGDPSLLAANASVTRVASTSDTKSGNAQIALFVDGADKGLYTGSFDGGAQLTGFAQRITVNPTVANNNATLVVSSATSSTGDGTRAQALYDALTKTNQTFSAASGIGGVDAPTSSTLASFLQNVIASQGQAATTAKSLDEGQSIALSTAQSRFASQSGVNIDEEMSKLIELQQAYSANARVLSAARDMLDTLLRI
ncbi:flagellar hook-associated protein FlgK [Methylobacterium organophilum]|uniref:flagellar hook-associated protein FlgK n=1 Tax=Methylobacterium organophilum TaxID=410 RepID=UPI001F13BD09|nr:flagellar hook-associated protein FlgK [Methylobacterium organophilum]UMY19072.1 flagellar hook-associated protein FlgK [Methylobacterium organophilum]